MDTEGHVGLHAYVGGAVGIGKEDDWALEMAMEAGVGTELVPGTLTLQPSGGFDFAWAGDDAGGRFGIRTGGHFAFGNGEPRARIIGGLACAWLLELEDHTYLGPELRVSLLAEDRANAGHFFLGVVYEHREIDDPFEDTRGVL